MFHYEDGVFVFSFSNLFHLSLNTIDKEKFNLFVSFVTLGGIFIAISQWMYSIFIRRKTDLNGLLEEIHHNFNIAGTLFLIYDDDIYWAKIFNILNNQDELIYPNPDNSYFDNKYFSDCLEYSKRKKIPSGLINLTDSFIKSAITSDNIFSLSRRRIYLNLGHLNYSISRYNLIIKNYNQVISNLPVKSYAFSKIQQEYYVWVNFRLSFMLVDLIMNTPEKYFIDKKYVRKIKKNISKKSI